MYIYLSRPPLAAKAIRLWFLCPTHSRPVRGERALASCRKPSQNKAQLPGLATHRPSFLCLRFLSECGPFSLGAGTCIVGEASPAIRRQIPDYPMRNTNHFLKIFYWGVGRNNRHLHRLLQLLSNIEPLQVDSMDFLGGIICNHSFSEVLIMPSQKWRKFVKKGREAAGVGLSPDPVGE